MDSGRTMVPGGGEGGTDSGTLIRHDTSSDCGTMIQHATLVPDGGSVKTAVSQVESDLGTMVINEDADEDDDTMKSKDNNRFLSGKRSLLCSEITVPSRTRFQGLPARVLGPL